jgi:hypothetical protein
MKSIFAAAVATVGFFAAPLAANAASFSKVADDNLFNALNPDLAFVAEGRMGNNAMNGTHELNFHGANPANESQTQDQANFVWNNGQTYDFKLDYAAATGLTQFFVDGVEKLSYSFSDAFSDIFIRTRATKTGSSINIDNIFLNGELLNGASSTVAAGGGAWADTMDYLRITGLSADEDFSLTGQSTMNWGEIVPNNSHLAFQIKVADVESTPEPTVIFGLGLASAGMTLLRRRQNA